MDLFLPEEPPWTVLSRIGPVLEQYFLHSPLLTAGEGVRMEGVHLGDGHFYIGDEAVLEPGVVLANGPIYIGSRAHLRSGAYIRGPAYIGSAAVLGHASECKNAVLLPGAMAPHFNYVGDSVLGRGANLGAGSILSNLRLDGRIVRVTWKGKRQDSGLRKFGALVGDGVQVGCNAVLNPGTILWPGTHVPPATAYSGEHGYRGTS